MKNKIHRPRLNPRGARVVSVRTETHGMAGIKTLVVIGLIFAELALLIYLYIKIAIAFRWYLILSFALSLATCIYVLSSQKNSLSKAVWILFLIVFFVFGYAIYIMSDERFFFRSAKRRFQAIFSDSEKYKSKTESSVLTENGSARFEKLLYNSGAFSGYKNTACEYFPSGALLFDDLLERLKLAENFVFMEFFIVSDGVLMERFLSVIEGKIKEGLDVRIIYDDMGSHRSLSAKMKKRLLKMGVKILPFNRLIPFFFVGLNYRDHRKIVVIDGKWAYTGGVNFADEYINEKRLFGYWKDSGVKIEGEAVSAFTLAFLRQWQFLSKKKEDFSPFFKNAESNPEDSLVIPFFDGLDYESPISKSAFESLISSAEERLYIMTPYFIPDDVIVSLLKNKALSGVDVRIILPGVADKRVVYGLSKSNAEKLIPYGVKLYCMDDAFVHSKLLLNEKSVIIGSCNMDLRSFYQQFESCLFTDSSDIVHSVYSDFRESFRASTLISEAEIRRRNIFERIFSSFLHLFAPFM